jgi:hypothetical protein
LNIPAEKLIIFDYSGTLSLESSFFAKPDNLMRHLEDSGLKDFGINSPGIFWEKIVNPSWMEGSTTSAGYKKVMEKRISAVLQRNTSIAPPARISTAVSSFVDSYLRHSSIDSRWKPVLWKLNEHPSARVIIATDHYAEATGYIIKFLNEFNIQAAAKDVFLNSSETCFIVANSADMGILKADPQFWEIIKTGLKLEAIHNILIIDDFGCNEQEGDSYGEQQKVEMRKLETVKMLKTVFPAEVSVVPFMIEDNGQKKGAIFGNLITEVAAIIDRFLASS